MDGKIRCWGGPQIFIDYHDFEWGRPVRDDKKFFEMLTLESMQSGLSWITVLNRREAFREAFDGFDFYKVAAYGEKKIEELMSNEKIIRNRLKILAAINNAAMFVKIAESHGSFSDFIWSYFGGVPLQGYIENEGWVPKTKLSEKISKDLKKLGFKFVGPTTVYSFMQATGLVNDHTPECFLYGEISREGEQK